MSRTVLVIDDDPDLLTAHRFVLERAGYRVLTAPDGLAGLDLAREQLPDLILLDLLMPKLDGFRALEAIRAQLPRWVRIIMLTANGAQAHRDLAEFLGADDYLEKPVTTDRLLETISRCLRSATDLQSAI